MECQEIFDKVYRHLMTQKTRSTDAYGRCVYRSEKGLKCAAGCLIEDAEYDPSMEHRNWFGAALKPIREKIGHESLVFDLQDIHDNTPPELWEEALKHYAKNFDMTIPEMP